MISRQPGAELFNSRKFSFTGTIPCPIFNIKSLQA
jgi:hypothetical protein